MFQNAAGVRRPQLQVPEAQNMASLDFPKILSASSAVGNTVNMVASAVSSYNPPVDSTFAFVLITFSWISYYTFTGSLSTNIYYLFLLLYAVTLCTGLFHTHIPTIFRKLGFLLPCEHKPPHILFRQTFSVFQISNTLAFCFQILHTYY